jgi:hypothetical protein
MADHVLDAEKLTEFIEQWQRKAGGDGTDAFTAVELPAVTDSAVGDAARRTR